MKKPVQRKNIHKKKPKSLFFGYPSGAIRSAVMSRLLSGEDILRGMPCLGEYELVDGQWYYVMERMRAGEPPMRMSVAIGPKQEEAIKTGCVHREFLLIDSKTKQHSILTVLSTEGEEAAKKALDQRIVKTYFDYHGIRDRKGVKELIDWFMSYMDSMVGPSDPSEPLWPQD